MNIFFMLMMLLIAGILFGIKQYYWNKFAEILPTDVRKTAARDSHECWATVEVEVDNFINALRLPHSKPNRAKHGEYYTNSNGVPNFVVYKDWDKQEIHSLIEIRGLDRPEKKFNQVIHTPAVKSRYKYLKFDLNELTAKTWLKKANKFYKKLREEQRIWAQQKEQDLSDAQAAKAAKEGENPPLE